MSEAGNQIPKSIMFSLASTNPESSCLLGVQLSGAVKAIEYNRLEMD